MNVRHDARARGGVVGRPAVCRADRPAEHGESIGWPAGRVVAFQGWRFPRHLRHTDRGASYSGVRIGSRDKVYR